MSTIYLSLPVDNPNLYAQGHRASWAQITYFAYEALSRQFPGNVKYLPYSHNIPLQKHDVLVSCAPNDQLCKMPERSIIIDNDNFEVSKWKHGKFDKYGLDVPTDHTYQFNKFLVGLYGAIIKTNEVAIDKWNSNHPDVFEKKQFLLNNITHVNIVPHPIDKAFFSKLYNPKLKLPKLKMLVYNAPWRKNAEQLVEMLRKHGFSSDQYSVISELNKNNQSEIKRVLSQYAYLAHISYSEGFPYFANEFLCQGLVLYGHEEWWKPASGYEILRWTYDPARQDQNLANLQKLLSSSFTEQYYAMRNSVVDYHLNRTDNNWDYLTNILVKLVASLVKA
jgi:hypothetical protein